MSDKSWEDAKKIWKDNYETMRNIIADTFLHWAFRAAVGEYKIDLGLTLYPFYKQ